MHGTAWIDTNGVSSFGYEATQEKGRRKAPSPVLRHEDDELRPKERKMLISAARDVHRNYTLVPWAIRRHLDFVAKFTPQIKTPNDKLTDLIEHRLRTWSKREHCDVARRHPLRRLIRLMEAGRTMTGDMALIRLANGQLQAIEGERIRSPNGGLPAELGLNAERVRHGVLLDRVGGDLAYAVCRRNVGDDNRKGSGEFVFERLVPAQNCYLHCYHDRIDQVRGISPLSSALNTFRDTADGIEYALAKMKVAQLFGLVTTREGEDPLGDVQEETETDGEGNVVRRKPSIDFGAGPFHMDLNPGEDAKFLENKTPSVEFQQFTQSMFALSLKSLDIPYSFFAEDYTNYSGQRQAMLLYNQAANDRRLDNQDLLDWTTGWRIWLDWVEGKLPGVDEEQFRQIRCAWIPSGLPWIDPLKEIQADIAAIDKGLTSPQRVCRERGEDWYEIQDERLEAKLYLDKLGIDTTVNPIPITINEAA